MQIGTHYKVISLIAPQAFTDHTEQASDARYIEPNLDDALAILQVGASVGDDNPTLNVRIQASKTTDTEDQYEDIGSFAPVVPSATAQRIASLMLNLGIYKYVRSVAVITDDDDNSVVESGESTESGETAASYNISLSILSNAAVHTEDLNSSDAGV